MSAAAPGWNNGFEVLSMCRPMHTPRPGRLLVFLACFLTFFLFHPIFSPVSAVSADSRVFYVSPSGNDANDGSPARPWKTIKQANNSLRAGDTVVLTAGVYRETIKPVRSGQAGAPIVYAAAGPDVIVAGSDQISGFTPHNGSIYRVGMSQAPNMLYEDNKLLNRVGSVAGMNAGGQWCFTNGTLYIRTTDNASPNNHSIEVPRRKVAEIYGISYIELRGLSVKHGDPVAIDAYQANNVTVQDCTVDGAWFHTVQFGGRSKNGVVRNCMLRNYSLNNEVGVGVEVQEESSAIIEGNTMTNTYGGGAQDGCMIELNSWAAIRNNTSYHNANDGLSLWRTGSSANPIVVEGNRVYDNGANGIHLCEVQHVVVRNNTAQNNSRTWEWQFGINLQLSNYITVIGNSVLQNRTAAIQFSGAEHGTATGNKVEGSNPGITITSEEGKPSVDIVVRENG
jgi:parallel beta-helix repeat protein